MRNWLKFGILLLLPLLALPAAAQDSSNKKQQSPTTLARGNASEQKPRAATEDPNYIIGPEDVLDISVWKEPDITRTVPVRPDGKISLPLLHDVQAAGLTPKQLGASVTESLKKYLTEPQVTVIVTAINSRRVYILGEVARPGAYPLLPDMTVLQALSTAGGFGTFANTKAIYVLRTENGKQNKHYFNYKEVVSGRNPQQNIPLQSGDTIVVP